MSQTKTGKTKSVQVSDAGYARVMETARQLRMTQLGAASLLIEAATPDGIKRVVNRALGNMTTAQTEPVRGVVPATVGGGHPGETRGGWCGRRRDLAGKDRTADTCRAPDPAGQDRTAGAYPADQARTAVRARPRVASGFVGAPSAELGGRGCPG